VKISVSLSAGDLELLDDYVRSHEGSSRSSALRDALELLRERALADEYAVAFADWEGSGEGDAWDATVTDGIGTAPVGARRP